MTDPTTLANALHRRTPAVRRARREDAVTENHEPSYAWAGSTATLQVRRMGARGNIEARRVFDRVIQERRNEAMALQAPHTTAAERLAIMETACSYRDNRPDESFLSWCFARDQARARSLGSGPSLAPTRAACRPTCSPSANRPPALRPRARGHRLPHRGSAGDCPRAPRSQTARPDSCPTGDNDCFAH
jgi:hypothetical protein